MNRKYQKGLRLRSRWIVKTTAGVIGACAFFTLTLASDAQIDTTWTGGTGNWFNPANWDTGITPSGGHNVFIDGGDTVTGSVVGTGDNGTIDIESLHVDAGDTLNIGNNFDLKITTNGNATSGVINNDGNINVTNAGNTTNLVIKNDVTLDGSGILKLDGSSGNSRIVDDSGSDGHLTNSSKIHGQGQIGANTLQLTNAADGWIDANIAGKTLTIDTNANGAVNQGKMRALNGGNLLITGGTNIDNTGGMIRAANDSTVTLTGSAAINGGLLESTGTGSIEIAANGTATVSGSTISGTLNQNNNTDLFLDGSITNNSTDFNVTNAGNGTNVVIDGTTTLTGGGSISLGGTSIESRIHDQSGSDGVLNNTDNSLQGHGKIGDNTLAINNQAAGLIDANISGKSLLVDPRTGGDLSNAGTMRASNGGELRLNGAGGGIFFNSGRIEAQTGSTVRMESGARVDGGDLESFGNGRFVVGPNQNAEIKDLTFDGQFDIENNTDLELFGTITNLGAFSVSNLGNSTDIQIESNVLLNGGGTVTLGGSSANSRILDESGSEDGIFTNVDNTIQGSGNVGSNRTEIINQSLIDANDSTGTLTLDPRDTGSQFTNTGTLRASNSGELVLEGGGGGKFFNTGGRIEAQNNSIVRLQGIASVEGGELESFGIGRFVVGPNQNAELKDVDFIGKLDIENNTDLELLGAINNQGAINVSNLGNATDIQIESNVSLTGGGTITLGGSSANSRILDESGSADGALTNVDNIIQGKGNIGGNRTTVDNSSLIDANDASGTLTLDPRNAGDQFTNTGTLRASGGGELKLDGSGGGHFLNAGGRIEAQNGSTVRMEGVARVDGGELESFGTGRFVVGPNQNAELKDVTFNGKLDVENNTDLELIGAINNQGSFTVGNAGNSTDIQIESAVSLTGGGTITLGGSSATASRILDETGSADGVLTNVDNTISGTGNVGSNRMGIINQSAGLITADVSGTTLVIDQIGTGFSNQGTLVAETGATMLMEDVVSNDGLIRADGLFDVDTNSLTNTATGTIQGNGLIDSSVVNSGTIGPGASVGTLTIDGIVDFTASSLLDVEVDAGGADLLDVMGDLTIGGDLSVSLLSPFEPDVSDFYTIAMADTDIMGTFGNVANGGTLLTDSGEGTFVVNYGLGSAFDSQSIVLSGFSASAVPEPGTTTALLALLTSSLLVRRRRS